MSKIDDLLRLAETEALAIGSDYVGVAHLLIAMLRFNEVLQQLCEKKGLTAQRARRAIRSQLGPKEEPSKPPLAVAQRLRDLFQRASEAAGSRAATERDVVLELKKEKEGVVGAFLASIDLESANIELTPSDAPRRGGLLDRMGRDLTDLALKGKLPARLRRPALEKRILMALSRHNKPNVVLIGDAGVGKTAVVEGLAARLGDEAKARGSEDKPAALSMRIVALDASSFIAGASLVGEMEGRLRKLVEEASELPNLVVFIDEFHALMGISRGALSALDILKPALARGELRIIGATTPKEYKAFVAKDEATARRFEEVDVPEPTVEETITILEKVRDTLGKHHGLEIDASAIHSAARLSHRYLPERRLPDKALDVLEEACTRARFRTNLGDDTTQTIIRGEDVADVVAAKAGVALDEISLEEKNSLADLEAAIRDKVVGQDDAVRAVARAVQISRVGLKQPNRPVGAFLLTGPSGVGKTLLAETIAKVAFGDGAFLRIDGSEFQHGHEISRLVGAPPGYKGHGTEGMLTGFLTKKPHAVVLIDEIDKSHPSLADLMLHVLDAARLTDGEGKTVNCSHALFLLTSNHLADNQRKRAPGFAMGPEPEVEPEEKARAAQDQARAELTKILRPELLGRLDAVLPMAKLDRTARVNVALKLLEDAASRLRARHVAMAWEAAVAEELASRGEAALGARTIRSSIDAEVMGAATDELLRARENPSEARPLRLRVRLRAPNRIEVVVEPEAGAAGDAR